MRLGRLYGGLKFYHLEVVMPRKIKAKIQAKSDRKIVFCDEITSDIIKDVVIPLQELDEDESGEPIDFYFNSNGGDQFSGMALCEAIGRVQSPLNVYIYSMAASMGALVAMAGYNNPNVKVFAYPSSVFLIHKGEVALNGNANAVYDNADFLKKCEQQIRNFILSHTRIGEELYAEKERQEWWMTADEAKSYGIVDEII